MQDRKYLLKALAEAIQNHDQEISLSLIELISRGNHAVLHEQVGRRDDGTVLHLAIKMEMQVIALKLLSLLEHDVIFATDPYKRSLFHLAAKHGCAQVLTELISLAKRQASKQWLATDYDGYTPLHIACAKGELAVARILLAEISLEKNARTLVNGLCKDSSSALILLLQGLHCDNESGIRLDNLREGYQIVLALLKLGANAFKHNNQLRSGYNILFLLKPDQFSQLAPIEQNYFLLICKELMSSQSCPKDFFATYSRYAGLNSLQALVTVHLATQHQVNPQLFTRLTRKNQETIVNDLHQLALTNPAMPGLRSICYQYASIHSLRSMLIVQHDFHQMPIRNTFKNHHGQDEFIEDDVLALMPAYRAKVLLAENDNVPEEDATEDTDELIEHAAEQDRAMLLGLMLEIDRCRGLISSEHQQYPYRNWVGVLPAAWLLHSSGTLLYYKLTTQPSENTIKQLALLCKIVGSICTTYVGGIWGMYKMWNAEKKISRQLWQPLIASIEQQVIEKIAGDNGLIHQYNYESLKKDLILLHDDQCKWKADCALSDIKFNLNIIQQNLTVSGQPLAFFSPANRKRQREEKEDNQPAGKEKKPLALNF